MQAWRPAPEDSGSVQLPSSPKESLSSAKSACISICRTSQNLLGRNPGRFFRFDSVFSANLCTRKLKSLSECGITIAYTTFDSAKGRSNYGKHPGIIQSGTGAVQLAHHGSLQGRHTVLRTASVGRSFPGGAVRISGADGQGPHDGRGDTGSAGRGHGGDLR